MLKIALAAATLALLIAPAEARISGTTSTSWPTPPKRSLPRPFSVEPSVGSEVRQLRRKVERARESGLISRSEARQLKREVRLLGNLSARYGHGGVSSSERAELQNRIHYLSSSIYAAGARSAKAGARKTR